MLGTPLCTDFLTLLVKTGRVVTSDVIQAKDVPDRGWMVDTSGHGDAACAAGELATPGVFPLLCVHMTSVLVFLSDPSASQVQASDWMGAGFEVLGLVSDRSKLVQAVVRHAPDVVVADVSAPDEAFFKAMALLAEVAPLPVLVFTPDARGENIERAVGGGIHAYVVGGYAPQRLRALVQLAQARFRHETALHEQLREVSTRFEERKVVDRAKGILMRARQLSDDEAYELLRTASMHTNRRLGQVSQQIIQSARDAECLNRAGQLRMLSQRLVKHRLLQLAAAQPKRQQPLLEASVQRVTDNLEFLHKHLSQPDSGDLLAAVRQTWAALAPLLRGTPQGDRVVELDALAEQLLRDAERLVVSLEQTGAVATLHVLNMAGRQRMLSQRFAKHALFEMLGAQPPASEQVQAMLDVRAEFEAGLRYLAGLPLSSGPIRDGLAAAGQAWEQMLAAVSGAARVAGRDRLARLELLASASESLLEEFEQLSAQYEHSMQMLMG